MLRSRSFIRRTRSGIQKVVREHYLRDDVELGVERLSADSATIIAVIDTNVALHFIDLLAHAEVTDVIVPQTALDEVRARSQQHYRRLRELIAKADKRFVVFCNEFLRDVYVDRAADESINDRNDRAIRRVAKHYQTRVPRGEQRVVLVSNDVGNRQRAKAEGVRTLSVSEWAALSNNRDLMDMAASADELTDAGTAGATEEFPEHESEASVQAQLAAGQLYAGVIHVGSDNSGESWIACETLAKDILIPSRLFANRAVDGDRVAVRLLPKSEWRMPDNVISDENAADSGGAPAAAAAAVAAEVSIDDADVFPTGRVVAVLKRNWRLYVATIDENAVRDGTSGVRAVLAVPVDRRIPRVRIVSRQLARLAGQRIVIAIDRWDRTSAHPSGHYVRTLGQSGDKAVETEVLLVEHDVPRGPFPPAAYACLPTLPWTITENDERVRADFRQLRVMSIDPPGCTDIDDALHVRRLPNGNFEVGVHIADVSHFVRPDTALDEEAARRCTTVYLVDRRIDMLPELLGTNLCSLRSNVDRFAFSCLWELTPDARIVAREFCRSIIHSRASFTYGDAQSLLDHPDGSEQAQDLADLNMLAISLKRRREESGALILASPAVKFDLDLQTHDPIDVSEYKIVAANSLVEEFMLLANCTVAERILEAFPMTSVLRRHPPPFERAFERLQQNLDRFDMKLDVTNSGTLQRSLNTCQRADDPYFNTLVRIMTTRCMTQAVYFCTGMLPRDQYHHYGLAAPLYTHFTSPIRRYADILVHRLLGAAIGIEHLPEQLCNKEGVQAVCNEINLRHRNAQFAGRASVDLHTLVFFRNRIVREEARIVRVKRNGVVVLVPRFGVEATALVSTKAKPSSFVYDAHQQVLKSERLGITLGLFDRVVVQLTVDEGPYRAVLRTEIIDPPVPSVYEHEARHSKADLIVTDGRDIVVSSTQAVGGGATAGSDAGAGTELVQQYETRERGGGADAMDDVEQQQAGPARSARSAKRGAAPAAAQQKRSGAVPLQHFLDDVLPQK